MNAGQYYGQQEYRAAAMRGFPALIESFGFKRRVYHGGARRESPLLKTAVHTSMWRILSNADKPISLTEIIQQAPALGNKTNRAKTKLVLLGWYRFKWLSRVGMRGDYLYFIKGLE